MPYFLTIALNNGDVVAIDLVESFKWFKVAAEGSNAETEWHLSLRNRCDKEFAVNDHEAERWARLALQSLGHH